MKRIKILILFLLLFCTFGYSQVWKPVQNKYQAQYIVYITDKRYEANFIAYQVVHEYQAIKLGLIFLAPFWYSRGTKVYFTKVKSEADIILYWNKYPHGVGLKK
jgi:hypothetical protein